MEIELTLEDIKVSTQNALGLEKPETYGCRVWTCHPLLPSLAIYASSKHKVEDFPNSFYLIFEPVDYFQGPMRWFGADFRTASHAECSRLWYTLHAGQTMEEDGISDMLEIGRRRRLFILEHGKIEIKIMARVVTIIEDLPEIFRKV